MPEDEGFTQGPGFLFGGTVRSTAGFLEASWALTARRDPKGMELSF